MLLDPVTRSSVVRDTRDGPCSEPGTPDAVCSVRVTAVVPFPTPPARIREVYPLNSGASVPFGLWHVPCITPSVQGILRKLGTTNLRINSTESVATMNHTQKLARSIILALLGALAIDSSVLAKQGATDPIPGTSKGAVKSGGGVGGGGGGGKSSKTTPAPIPTPAPAPAPGPVLAAGPITFSQVSPSMGSGVVCTGDFRVDPYYPTLLDMTVNVHVDSLQVPDGTVLYIQVSGAGGTLYPWTSNAIVVTGGVGNCSEHVFVTLGASLAGVTITDASGQVMFTGQ